MKYPESLKIERRTLRDQLRDKRHHLSAGEQDNSARRIAATALTQADFPVGEHCALYMDADGEVGTQYLLQALWAQGKACYLPVLVKQTMTLLFRQTLPDHPLITNYFGLLEPEAGAPEIAPADLTTVFMPLVGFDDRGNRLGMGGGFYDRTFAFLKEGAVERPALIGLAHECQRVEGLETATWDVPLRGIITGKQFYRAG